MNLVTVDSHIIILTSSGLLAGVIPLIYNNRWGLGIGFGFFLVTMGELFYLIKKCNKMTFPK